MATYYPIEFLPENKELGNPTTRNFLRNNLPVQPLSESNVDEASVANFGKQITYLESSINNNPVVNQHEINVDKSITSNKIDLENNITNSSKTNKTQNRYTRINIDSRLRNIQPKHILDTNLNTLTNAIYFTENSNSIIVNHPNHGYSVEDKIILEFATSVQVKIKGGLFFEKGSTFAKINQPNHGMINGNTYTIQISNVVGDISSGTFLINYPVNIINKTHQVYFVRSSTDQFDPNNYYIQLGIVAEAQFTYMYSFNISYLNIRNIPLNQINANYPISPDRINGFQIIDSVINNNFYSFSVNSNADSSTLTGSSINYNSNTPLLTGDGGTIMIIKVNSTISGYPNNNNYQISLQRNFYRVTQIKLINTIFPITQKLINNTPISIKNNLFYWQNLSDGNIIYSVAVPSGNYSLTDLQIELTSLINSVVRPNINSNILVNDIYTYNTNYSVITIDQNKNTFSIQFFQRVILSNAIFKDTTIYPDGFTRVTITYKNHGLIVGNVITFSNVIGTDGIPTINLNGNFTIETVIDINTFLIKLDRFNSDTTIGNTNGGTAINILLPIQSRLLFNVPNTIGNVLGFNNIGDSNSVTSYSYKINNYDLYEVDTLENSVGVITQPRQDTRILNVNPNNYILMLTDIPFNDQINLFNTSSYAMAKIYLAGQSNSYVYDQFIQLGSGFQEPISTLSTISFSFYGPDNNLYDFNNIEHSFTIEIVEELSELVIESYNLS
jgi:hypothetical protein